MHFSSRYWAPRYWAPRYWGTSGGVVSAIRSTAIQLRRLVQLEANLDPVTPVKSIRVLTARDGS